MKKIHILLTVVPVFSFLFCNIVAAFPPLPHDLNIVQPDPSLPKELAAFSGKWEGKFGSRDFFLIVEKIDQEKAILLFSFGSDWERREAKVAKEYGKWQIYLHGSLGLNILTLRGKEKKILDIDNPAMLNAILKAVP